MFPIKEVTGLDVAFGGNIELLMPRYEDIPKEFKRCSGNVWVDLVNRWFFSGLKNTEFIPKNTVDKSKALAHIRAIMVSFAPAHEHKAAGCAFLLAEWFEDVKVDGKSVIK